MGTWLASLAFTGSVAEEGTVMGFQVKNNVIPPTRTGDVAHRPVDHGRGPVLVFPVRLPDGKGPFPVRSPAQSGLFDGSVNSLACRVLARS
jgi:hypothetical protein